MTILFSMLFISGTEGEDMVTTRVIIPRTHGKNFNSALFNIYEVASRRLPLGNFSYVNVNPIQVLAVLEPVNMARLLLRTRHKVDLALKLSFGEVFVDPRCRFNMRPVM